MAPEAEIDVRVDDAAWTAALPDCEALCSRAVAGALAGAAAGDDAEGGEIAVLFADDATVRELNRSYRHRDKPTNVLSFPADHDPQPGQARLLGDIVLAFGTVAAEAEEQGKSLSDHMTHLVVHGVLHLLGFDHENDDDAEEMEGLETEILRRLGIADPYEEASVIRHEAVAR